MKTCRFILLFIFIIEFKTFHAFNIETASVARRGFVRSDGENTNGYAQLANNMTFFGYSLQGNVIEREGRKIISVIVGAPLQIVDDYTSTAPPEEGGERVPTPLGLRSSSSSRSRALKATESSGVLYACDMLVDGFTLEENATAGFFYNCTNKEKVDRNLEGPDISSHDTLGATLVSDKRPNSPITALLPKDYMLTCAPLRAYNCSSNYKAEGTCYLSKVVPGRGDGRYSVSWSKRSPCREECTQSKIDLMFLVDGSESITVQKFETVKNWIINVASGFDISEPVQVGVVQYSHWYQDEDQRHQPYLKTEIALGTHKNQRDFATAVKKIKFHGFTTYTAHAITKVVRDDFNGTNSRYPLARRVMILLTDGNSTDRDDLDAAVAYSRDNDVTSFAVGVKGYQLEELLLIAGSKSRVITVQNFNELQGIVEQIQFGIQLLEGSSNPNTTNGLMQCQAGISSDMSQNGRLYLGAVGAYDWSGTVTKYDTLTDNVADIPTYEEVKRVLPNRTKESYMGYSVTTGTFAGGTTEYVATGAPRYKLMGAVVIYRPVDGNSQFNDDRRLMGHPSKRKLGSYFGGSVLAVDINGDGKDDLLVGAPLYVHESFDEGRVFVYETNRGSGTLAKWESDTYAPKELVGDNLAGGRFGTAMASAGDLNKDNFNDVIIGAPLVDGDRGAVFVYHGSIDGIDTAFKQKILASQLTGVTLKYFGQSLQGGVDLDGNKYPDIAVGAPKSDTVVIFRARPVVKITPEIKFSGDSAIDIFKCIIDDRYINCSAITVCLTASGTSIEPQISLKFNVTMDTKKADADKRLEFRDDVAKSGTAKFTWSEKFTVPRNTKKCFTKQVHMKTNVNDYDSNVTAEVEYDLTPEHTAVAMSSVRDPSKSNKKSAVLQFEQNCKGSCEPDLGVTLSLNVPSYTANNDQQNDLSQSNTILIVDKSTTVSPLAGRVNLSNFGENAFGARVRIRYPPEIGWRSVKVIDSNPPSNSCIVPDSTSETENGFVTQTLRFNSKTNIMRGNSFCHFEFSLITDPLKKNGLLDNFTVKAESFLTSDTATESKDKKTGNNRRQKKIGLLYTSDMSAKEVGSSVDISFNHTRNETRNITSVREIGNGTDDIVAQFTVLGNGYSKIPVVTTTLNFPWMTEDNETLLYLFDVTCQSPSSDSGTSCLCEHANVNYLNLSTEPPVENNTSENYVTVTRRTNVMENLEYNCNNASTSVICQKVKCTIQNLGERDEVTFQASFRLWTDNLLLNSTEERARLELRSRFEVNSSPSVRIIDANGIAPIVKSVESVVTARLYKPPSTPEPAVNNLWIYILAAVGGLLLLIILVLILWKLGFFKSKYADMKKDAQEDLQEETEFPDQNGSK